LPALLERKLVADTGTIDLPLVGEAMAASRTAQEVERVLAKRLGAK
jgi:protein involved in polysaccharide export with SLBB domain